MPLIKKSVLKIRFNKKQRESSKKTKTKKKKKCRLFSSYIESPIFNTNPSNIKLQMLQEGLKCKQLKEEI